MPSDLRELPATQTPFPFFIIGVKLTVFCLFPQVSWAVADGEENKAQDQTYSCAGFFANLCAHGKFTTGALPVLCRSTTCTNILHTLLDCVSYS